MTTLSGVGPRAPVAPPQLQPPTIGLLPTFRALDDPGERWEFGFAFAPENCGATGIAAPCDRTADKSIDANRDIVEGNAFFVWGGDKCAPFETSRNRRRRAENLLLAAQSYQIAHELWTGTVAQDQGWGSKYLASPEADVLNNPIGDPAFSAINGLACLEQALGQCSKGARGVIHCTRQLATIWDQAGMLRREGALILTVLDTFVIPDAGYDGSGPDGNGPVEDSQWAYATGIPQIRLENTISHWPDSDTDPAELAQGLDRDTNLIEFRAERRAAVTWDGCCHLAVNIDVPLCYVGGAS